MAKEGYGPLVSKTPRFIQKQSASTIKRLYHPRDFEKPVKRCPQPFGRAMKEKIFSSMTPG